MLLILLEIFLIREWRLIYNKIPHGQSKLQTLNWNTSETLINSLHALLFTWSAILLVETNE